VMIMAPVKGEFDADLERAILPHGFVAQLVALGKPDCKVVFANDAVMADLGVSFVCSNLLDSSTIKELPQVMESLVEANSYQISIPDSFKDKEWLTRHAAWIGEADKEVFVTLTVSRQGLHLRGRFQYGEMDEPFPLQQLQKRSSNGKAASKTASKAKDNDESSLPVGLDYLGKLVEHASKIGVVPDRAVLMSADDNTLFVVGTYIGARKKD
jgi:hypothetical protein